jgi:hypothetical protein
MKTALALSLVAVALSALFVFSGLDGGPRWETVRVYPLAGTADVPSVAVAVPSAWRETGQVSSVGSSLRFVDAFGREIVIPRTALERAAAEHRVYRPARGDAPMLATRDDR